MILNVYTNTKTDKSIEVDGSFEVVNTTKRNGRIKIVDVNTDTAYWINAEDISLLDVVEEDVPEEVIEEVTEEAAEEVEEIVEEPVEEVIEEIPAPVVEEVKEAVKKPIYYTVCRGDTVTSICTRYGLSIADVFDYNPGIGNSIYIGQRIIIGYEG